MEKDFGRIVLSGFRELISLAGRLGEKIKDKYFWTYTEMEQAVGYLLFFRDALKKQEWNGTVNLSNESITQLDWWIQNLSHWNGKSMIPEVSKTTIFTDASISGWGASRENCTIHGRWSTMERQLHINLLELQAILFALMAFKS